MPVASDSAMSRRLEGMVGWLRRLSLQPYLARVAPGDWLGTSSKVDDIVELASLGRTKGLLWFGLVTTRGRCKDVGWVKSLVELLLGRGVVCGVVLSDSGGGLTMSVTFGECPVLRLGTEGQTDQALDEMAVRLREVPEDLPLRVAAEVAAALRREDAGRRFFLAVGKLHRRMVSDLTGLPAGHREHIALIQIIRVLFLYFLQSRGWLAGRSNFLSYEVAECLSRGRSIQRHLLHPLFFGTLNQVRERRRGIPERFRDIPYLNGGLFQPHTLERSYRIRPSDATWSWAFDEVFERFRFTGVEREAPDVIAPDMLGGIFERLMSSTDRKASGTYYTPAALAKKLIVASLTAYTARRIGCTDGEAEARVLEHDPSLGPMMTELRVLDPAVGSGAFLIGALDQLLPWRACARPRRAIVEQQLFGVDKDPLAVRLTELRLWLAMLDDESGSAATDVRPLPNLDCMIRQGDTLYDPVSALIVVTPLPPESISDLARLRQDVVESTSEDKARAISSLRGRELQVCRASLRRAARSVERSLAELASDAGSPDLFGKPRGWDTAGRRALAQGKETLAQITKMLQRLATHEELPWFQFESHFADVMARGGFDLVLGNPPWVRAEKLPVAQRRYLRGRFRWWRCSGVARRFRHQPDLSLAFLERAWGLAAPEGVVGFLLPAKIQTAEYARAARESMARHATLHAVADLGVPGSKFFSAAAYPLGLIGSKALPAPQHRVRSTLEAAQTGEISQRRLSGAPWILARSHRVIQRLGAEWPTIGDTFSVSLGVKTGANRVFFEAARVVEAPLRRQALRGRDIIAWHARPRIDIAWTHDPSGTPLAELPPRAAQYFKENEQRLIRRKDFRGGPPWQVFRTAPLRRSYLVVWPDLARELSAAVAYGPNRPIPLNTCYLIGCDDYSTVLSLLAWLNSSWIGKMARLRADVARGNYARFNAAVVSSLPLPAQVMRDADLKKLAENFLAGTGDQAVLDDRVAEVLSLSRSELDALAA